MKGPVFSVCVLLVLQIHVVQLKHVMMLASVATSHCLEMRSIGEELINRGHKVTALLLDRFDHSSCLEGTRINTILFPIPNEEGDRLPKMKTELSSKLFMATYGFMESVNLVKAVQSKMCNLTLTGAYKIKTRLLAEKFDAAMVDAVIGFKCFFGIPYMLNIPYYFAQGSVIDHYMSNLPMQFNSFPHYLFPSKTPMPFLDRVKACASQIAFNLAYTYLLSADSYGALLGPEHTNLNFEKLFRNSDLFIENADHVLDVPVATFPNFIQTGPLTARPPKKLDLNFEKFLSKSSEGVIYVSFGSFIESFPADIKQRFFVVFKQLKYQIIFKEKEDKEEGNVKTVKWIQQNDILGHKKTVLFISHCGKNSFFESLYHGVPIICSPLNMDAFSVALKVKQHNVGREFDVKTISTEDLLKLVRTVINDNTIKENMKRASTIIKDRPFTPAQTAANAIEHVLKYGSDHMKSPLRDFSLFSYTGADVWFFLFTIIFCICWLVTKLFFKCCCRKQSPGGEAKPKKKRE